MRYKVGSDSLDNWFANLRIRSGISWAGIANMFGVSKRTLYEWRTGGNTIPDKFLFFAKSHFGMRVFRNAKILSDNWSKSESGKLGGLERINLFGNPGTNSGRKLGGLHAISTHRKNISSPFNPRKVSLPFLNAHLAEFVGIVLGDGGIQARQIVITLHKIDDKPYAEYVSKLIKKLFHVNPSVVTRKKEMVINIILSRVLIVNFLKEMGLPSGNKVKHQVEVPYWIMTRAIFRKSCIRGLVDTDGCLYVDRHVVKGKVYLNCGINFSNRSLPLLSFFRKTLTDEGYHPTQRTAFAVFLRRESEIRRYLREIGSSNEKILLRFEKYCREKYGRVPKRS